MKSLRAWFPTIEGSAAWVSRQARTDRREMKQKLAPVWSELEPELEVCRRRRRHKHTYDGIKRYRQYKTYSGYACCDAGVRVMSIGDPSKSH